MKGTIVLAPFGSELQKTSVGLRDQVLRKPLGLRFKETDLGAEDKEFHILYLEGSQVRGVLLLRPLNKERVKMRQVAVEPDLQGKGIGAALVHWSEEFSRTKGFRWMELSARVDALRFYDKLGYNKVGDAYEEIGIEHWKMEKGL